MDTSASPTDCRKKISTRSLLEELTLWTLWQAHFGKIIALPLV